MGRRCLNRDVGNGAVLGFLIGGPRSGCPPLTKRLRNVCCFPLCVSDFVIDLSWETGQVMTSWNETGDVTTDGIRDVGLAEDL